MIVFNFFLIPLFIFNVYLFSYDRNVFLNLISSDNYKEAYEKLAPLVDKEEPQAMSLMAYLYMEGKGVEKNLKKAFELYKKSADKGFEKAYYNVGMCYEYGIGVNQDINLALEYYKKGYENGDPKSSVALAKLYFKGCKVGKDENKAIDYAYFACRKNYSLGCYTLGEIYENQENYKKAIKYYKKAGKYNYIEAYIKLGDLYFYGVKGNLDKDLKKAVKYYKKSDKEPYSMYQLGRIHFINNKLISSEEAINYLEMQ